jgi:hypothetical protein
MERIMKNLLASAVLVLLVGCATGLRTQSDHDPAQSFAGYRTYAWVADEPMIAAGGEVDRVSPLNRRRIVDAIEAELKTRGFEKASDRSAASFTVSYTVGARDRIDVYSYPEMYRHPWSWGRPYFGREADVSMYTEGTLAIDIFDGATRRPVWHGWASRRITEQDVKRAAELIPPAVADILKSFPPG